MCLLANVCREESLANKLIITSANLKKIILNKNTKIGVIGNGSWGTALTKILTDNGHTVHWWLRKEAAVQHLKMRHHNRHYLTSVRFMPGAVAVSADLQAVLEQCDTVVFAVPSACDEEVLKRVPADDWAGKKVVSAVKGIMPET